MDDHTTLMMTLNMLVVVAERQEKIVRTLSRLDEQVRAYALVPRARETV